MENLAKDINEVNLAYLMLAQKLLHEDKEVAMLRLGIDEDSADTLLSLTSQQIMSLASSSFLVCEFKVDDAALLKQLAKESKIPIVQEARKALSLLQGGNEGIEKQIEKASVL